VTREFGTALIVCTRRIGDVLLATPLVHSLKQARPHMTVDMLVFEGTQDVVSAWPALGRVWTLPERAPAGVQWALLRALWRRYDVALSVLAGDRPTFYAWVAGRYRVGTLLADKQSRWKRMLLHEWVPFDNLHTHTIAMNLQLLAPLGIGPVAQPVVSWRPEHERAVQHQFPGVQGARAYAVLHVSPKFPYKTWTLAGWVAVARWLAEQGLSIVVTGGPSPEEQAQVAQVTARLPAAAVQPVPHMSLPSVGYLLSRAALYVGTDTAVSHMAAALGTPTVVLFGPSNPVKWGPWPKDCPASFRSPWNRRGSQRQGNVFLIQGEGECVPCLHEGCDRHLNSLSDCLQTLSVDRVIHAAADMLGPPQGPMIAAPRADALTVIPDTHLR
jgi:heptosyltransferase III